MRFDAMQRGTRERERESRRKAGERYSRCVIPNFLFFPPHNLLYMRRKIGQEEQDETECKERKREREREAGYIAQLSWFIRLG